MEVEVMYSDLTRHRVPLDRIADLPTIGVLFIIVSAPDAERPRRNGRRRCLEAHGKDYYALGWHRPGRVRHVFLDGWNEGGMLTVRSERDPFRASSRLAFPWAVEHILFEGELVPDYTWAKALQVFHEEMH